MTSVSPSFALLALAFAGCFSSSDELSCPRGTVDRNGVCDLEPGQDPPAPPPVSNPGPSPAPQPDPDPDPDPLPQPDPGTPVQCRLGDVTPVAAALLAPARVPVAGPAISNAFPVWPTELVDIEQAALVRLDAVLAEPAILAKLTANGFRAQRVRVNTELQQAVQRPTGGLAEAALAGATRVAFDAVGTMRATLLRQVDDYVDGAARATAQYCSDAIASTAGYVDAVILKLATAQPPLSDAAREAAEDALDELARDIRAADALCEIDPDDVIDGLDVLKRRLDDASTAAQDTVGKDLETVASVIRTRQRDVADLAARNVARVAFDSDLEQGLDDTALRTAVRKAAAAGVRLRISRSYFDHLCPGTALNTVISPSAPCGRDRPVLTGDERTQAIAAAVSDLESALTTARLELHLGLGIEFSPLVSSLGSTLSRSFDRLIDAREPGSAVQGLADVLRPVKRHSALDEPSRDFADESMFDALVNLKRRSTSTEPDRDFADGSLFDVLVNLKRRSTLTEPDRDFVDASLFDALIALKRRSTFERPDADFVSFSLFDATYLVKRSPSVDRGSATFADLSYFDCITTRPSVTACASHLSSFRQQLAARRQVIANRIAATKQMLGARVTVQGVNLAAATGVASQIARARAMGACAAATVYGGTIADDATAVARSLAEPLIARGTANPDNAWLIGIMRRLAQ